jgi:hypothetical protein
MKITMPLKFALLAIFAALAFGATDIHFSSKTKIGSLVLPAGDYSLTVKESVAQLKDEASGKVSKTAVKAQAGDVKFRQTIVNAVNENGESRVRSIEVGGSNTTLVFD